MYCSHSCRQMSYIERKTEHSGTSVLSGNHMGSKVLNHNHTRETESPEPALLYRTEQENEPEQQDGSAFLTELRETIDNSETERALSLCLSYYQDPSDYVVACNIRCLTECTLMLSEARNVKTSDLMELCNAFTHLIYSDVYNNLPEAFPYTHYISRFREKLKRFCLDVHPSQHVRFGLRQEDKIQMILIRYELSDYVPKKTFRQLQAEQTEEHQEKQRRKNKS